jgi:hypothetical protein
MSEHPSTHEQRLFHVMLAMSGHDPADFHWRSNQQGEVEVQGPNGTASYRREHWLSPFARDLYRGYFKAAGSEPTRH